jgi:cyclase
MGNAGIVDLGDRTLVFDPFLTRAAARELRSAAERLTGRTPALVVPGHGPVGTVQDLDAEHDCLL